MQHSRSKEELLRRAMRFFCANGIKEISQRSIQREFGLNPGEFQGQFVDKEDFIRQAVELYLTEHTAEQNLLQAQSHQPLAELVLMIRHHILQLQQINPNFFVQIQYLYPRVWMLYLRHVQIHSYYMFYDLLNKCIEHKYLRPDLNIEIVTKVLLEQVNMLLNQNLFPSNRYNPTEVFRGIFKYYLRGLSTDKGNLSLESLLSEVTLQAEQIS
jgi:AcrR family transcriptional regulator